MPHFLSSLLHRSRTGLLMLLLVVLPLQGMVPLLAGLDGHRHLHLSGGPAARLDPGAALSALIRPLRAVLDELHALQVPRLQGARFAGLLSPGSSAGLHAHGGLVHAHSILAPDVIDVAEPTPDGLQGGATAFLAWLPVALTVAAAARADRPVSPELSWRGRVVPPPLEPPRG